MLGHSLPGHVEVLAEFAQGLPIFCAQRIEQFPAAGIGEGFEDGIHRAPICNRLVACQAAISWPSLVPQKRRYETDRRRLEVPDVESGPAACSSARSLICSIIAASLFPVGVRSYSTRNVRPRVSLRLMSR